MEFIIDIKSKTVWTDFADYFTLTIFSCNSRHISLPQWIIIRIIHSEAFLKSFRTNYISTSNSVKHTELLVLYLNFNCNWICYWYCQTFKTFFKIERSKDCRCSSWYSDTIPLPNTRQTCCRSVKPLDNWYRFHTSILLWWCCVTLRIVNFKGTVARSPVTNTRFLRFGNSIGARPLRQKQKWNLLFACILNTWRCMQFRKVYESVYIIFAYSRVVGIKCSHRKSNSWCYFPNLCLEDGTFKTPPACRLFWGFQCYSSVLPDKYQGIPLN
jgi:hypothetical protein